MDGDIRAKDEDCHRVPLQVVYRLTGGDAEQCVQVLAKRGVDIAFVGGSSSVLAAGGFCATGGNIVLWDTLAPISAGPIAFLTHHTPLVTALQVQ